MQLEQASKSSSDFLTLSLVWRVPEIPLFINSAGISFVHALATLLFALILEFPLEIKPHTNQNIKTTVSTHVPNYPNYAMLSIWRQTFVLY